MHHIIIIYHIHVRFIGYIEYYFGVSNKIITQNVKVINLVAYKLLFIVGNGIGHSI
jgi:hypothetical protein